MKKIFALSFTLILTILTLTGCGGKTTQRIYPVSREDGSGTRGAFVDIFKIEEKNSNGEKIDKTVSSAEITNSTSVMMTTISGNKNAIGYISLGSLNNTVKALKIDGIEASTENIKNGEYKASRPFNIATLDNLDEVSSDFIKFILSTQGQKVVEDKGYIGNSKQQENYSSKNLSGLITVAGSSSVAPVMEALKESYIKLNPNVQIQVQQSDSTSGMTSTIEGICNIGMASRDLKESELSKGLKPTTIALDGIAVIVNKENAVDTLTSEQIRKIFIGEATEWQDFSNEK